MNAIPGRYPAAAWEPVSYIDEASLMSNGSLGWVEHVVVGDGDPHGGFEHAPPGNRRFSHLWFAKDGRVRQYQDLRHDSWAQADGNDTYWSCETEGDPSEPLTDTQLDALAAWHVWSGTADAIATVPGQRGVGTHQMGGAAWGGHACPGPLRAAQRPEIIRRAQILRGGVDMPLTDAEITRIADVIETRYQVHVGKVLETRDQALGDLIAAVAALPAAVAEAVAARLPAGATVDVTALAAQCATATATELATRLVR